MAIIGVDINKQNPEFDVDDFTMWCPQFKKYIATDEGTKYFNKLLVIANKKIKYSIFTTDWEIAMSLCIAHYLTLIAQQMEQPAGDSLSEIAGGGAIKGVLSSVSVGSFSKSYDLNLTTLENEGSKFWNLTDYGAKLAAIIKQHPVPRILVITSGQVNGGGRRG